MNPAQAAVWFYLLTFAIPWPLDIGLMGLAGLGGWAALSCSPQFPRGALLAPLLSVLVIACGHFFSPDPNRSISLSLALVPASAIYLLICGYLERPQLLGLSLLLSLMICLLGGWLLGIALSHPKLTPSEWVLRSGLTAFRVPNDVVFFSILLPFPLALLKAPPRIFWPSALAAVACLITLAVAVAYQSRLAILTAGISSTALSLTLHREAKPILKMVALLALGVVLIDAAFGFKLLAKFQASWTSRLPLWLAAWNMFLTSPWFGHGLGSYALLYRDYLNSASFPSWIAFDPRQSPWAHNLYLEVLAELGILGGIALAFLLISPLRKRPKHPSTPSIRGFAYAAKAALLAFALSAGLELSLWRQWVGLIFLLIIGCITATNKSQEGSL